MKAIVYAAILTFTSLSVQSLAQTVQDPAKLKASIDSIRHGRNLPKNERGVIDTGTTAADTMSAVPNTPTSASPNNPNPHDPRPTTRNPDMPNNPNPVNPNQGKPVGPAAGSSSDKKD